MRQLLSLFTENKPEALARIINVVNSRGCALKGLTVAQAEEARRLRIILSVEAESKARLQLVKQLEKIVEVLEVKDFSELPAYEREFAIFRVRVDPMKRLAASKAIEACGARLLEASSKGYTLEAMGDREKLKALSLLLQAHGELEVVQSGPLVLARSP